MSDVAPTADDTSVATEPSDAPEQTAVDAGADPTDSPSDATPTADASTTPGSTTEPTPSSEPEPTSEPAAAPEPVDPTAPVIPATTFHDTRELQAAVDAGVVDGITTEGHHVIAGLSATLTAVRDWVRYAESLIDKLKGL